MYIIQHPYNNTHICLSEDRRKNVPHVIEVGYNSPRPGYSPKNIRRDCYVLHYVVSGKGTYYDQIIEGPCGFLLTPQVNHFYQVDSDPKLPHWEQYWIMLSGEGAKDLLLDAGFSDSPHRFSCPYIQQAIEIIKQLLTVSNYVNQNDYYYMMSGLYQLLSLHSFTQTFSRKETKYSEQIRTICSYIENNYATITHEEQLAKVLHISTSHMHRIFVAETGMTPVRYLTEHRIRCSKNLLKNSDLSIAQISDMIGFSNPNYFCTVFRQYCNGVSPSVYRKKHRQNL